MSVLTPAERDALIESVSRRWHLWEMHRVKETLTEAPRSFNPGYTDTYLLYEELTSGFDDANHTAVSREELLEQVDALANRLEAEYVVAFGDARTREEFRAMVADMRRIVRGGRE
jgi:hypothetical protein